MNLRQALVATRERLFSSQVESFPVKVIDGQRWTADEKGGSGEWLTPEHSDSHNVIRWRNPPGRVARHWHAATETCLILSGSVTFYMDEGSVTVDAGESITIPPFQPHACEFHEPSELFVIFAPAHKLRASHVG